MKHLPLNTLQTVVIAVFLILFIIPEIRAEEDVNVAFRWAFGAMVGPKHDRSFKTITGDTSLKTGDQLKFCVELQKRCFVYLIYHSGQGDLEMLFPYNLEQLTTNFESLRKYCIPQGSAWFELDEKGGLETFYLLASDTRLNELEQFFQKPGSNVPGDKQKRVQQILAQISTLKRQNRKLTASAERPVPIGGSVRGINRDTKTESFTMDTIEVSASTFYSRTFTIEHQ